MDIHNIDRAAAFTTKDGSEIRELLAHRNSCIRNQSLAEARLPAGRATMPHLHPQSEEIYYIIEGQGEMILAHENGQSCPVTRLPFHQEYPIRLLMKQANRSSFCAVARLPTSMKIR